MKKIYANWTNQKSNTRHTYWVNCNNQQDVDEALDLIKCLAEDCKTQTIITEGAWKKPGKVIERLPLR